MMHKVVLIMLHGTTLCVGGYQSRWKRTIYDIIRLLACMNALTYALPMAKTPCTRIQGSIGTYTHKTSDVIESKLQQDGNNTQLGVNK